MRDDPMVLGWSRWLAQSPSSPWPSSRSSFRSVSTDHFALLGAKVDGTEIQQLARSDVAQPCWVDWSPDGSELLVAHVAEGRRVASIASTDGSQAMRRLAVGDLEPEVPTTLGLDCRLTGDA